MFLLSANYTEPKCLASQSATCGVMDHSNSNLVHIWESLISGPLLINIRLVILLEKRMCTEGENEWHSLKQTTANLRNDRLEGAFAVFRTPSPVSPNKNGNKLYFSIIFKILKHFLSSGKSRIFFSSIMDFGAKFQLLKIAWKLKIAFPAK